MFSLKSINFSIKSVVFSSKSPLEPTPAAAARAFVAVPPICSTQTPVASGTRSTFVRASPTPLQHGHHLKTRVCKAISEGYNQKSSCGGDYCVQVKSSLFIRKSSFFNRKSSFCKVNLRVVGDLRATCSRRDLDRVAVPTLSVQCTALLDTENASNLVRNLPENHVAMRLLVYLPDKAGSVCGWPEATDRLSGRGTQSVRKLPENQSEAAVVDCFLYSRTGARPARDSGTCNHSTYLSIAGMYIQNRYLTRTPARHSSQASRQTDRRT